MAPREATGTFPDQFLTFDYDASVPMGAPPPHEPPGPGLGAIQNDAADGDESGPGTTTGAQDALNHVGTSTQSGSEAIRSTASNVSHVDPLSIDPTVDQVTPWSTTNMHHSVVSRFPLSNVDALQNQHIQGLPSPEGVTTVSQSFPFISSVLETNDHCNEDGTASPISTGTSIFHGGTAPNSPMAQTQIGIGAPNVIGPSPIPASDSSRRRSQIQVQSVLDSSTSIESDDDDDDDIPGLERTFDSVSTSHPADDWEGENLQNEDDNGSSSPCPGQTSSDASASSSYSSGSLRMIYRNAAFDLSADEPSTPPPTLSIESSQTPSSPNSIMLSFGPSTTVSDLKYFAERGCIVALLQALTTPRLVTLGTRMLADYAKMSHRRVAVASNRRILEFVQRTMLQISEHADWLGREYAVETIRSLTATEESDRYLMGAYGLLNTLALVARGGPFVTSIQEKGVRCTVPLASEKARLHACIAIMNLSCGKANKIEIAKVSDVLEAMRDVMVNSTDEARLKATTCVKNLSNADANDASLLGTPGLVEALGHVAAATCSHERGATPCTTNACLALMNLSISKPNKHRVFRTPGVMDALMTVLERTTAQGSSTEARVKACSALSNLAIGYDNKIPMFSYPGFVDAILNVIQTDTGEARTKACSILWSFAAEMKNQVPVVRRGDILPVLVRVAEEDGTTEARFKCVAALTLLAESLDNAIPLLESGALVPLMDILHEAGPDPTQWKGQTASWCVGFLMNIAQSDEAVPALREAGVVELLAPLLTLDHYQSLKAAMAVTFVCRYDEGDECYDLLRKTENVIPKIISLLHNTLSGRGGNGYKYGVFTLRSSVGCISALASGPDFMKERIATGPVYESLLRVVTDFCVNGGTPGAIVGGGRDDALSATLAIRALQLLTGHLIPIVGSSALPFGQSMEDRLLTALGAFETCRHSEIKEQTLHLATDAKNRIQGGRKAEDTHIPVGMCPMIRETDADEGIDDVASNCCGLESIPGIGEEFLHVLTTPSISRKLKKADVSVSSVVDDYEKDSDEPVRTFLLTDAHSNRRFVVPTDRSGGRAFNDSRIWCFRRGRYCEKGEEPDANFVWTEELQEAYEDALECHGTPSDSDVGGSRGQ